MASVFHRKVNQIADWTQAELDAQIAAGNFAPGTLLADITLPQDWNDDHDVSQLVPVTAVTSGPFNVAAESGLSIFTIYNAGSSAFTINLPASPALNQIAQFIDAGLTADAHNITVQGNGNSICAYGQIGSAAAIASNGGSISLAWDGVQWTQNG